MSEEAKPKSSSPPQRYDDFNRNVPDEELLEAVGRFLPPSAPSSPEEPTSRDPKPPHLQVLELGCGRGIDVRELQRRHARHFYSFTASDRDITNANAPGNREDVDADNGKNEKNRNKSITFINHALPEKLPFGDNSFRLIFSRLTLHYFDATVLREQIFPELCRVLLKKEENPGALIFVVKTHENIDADAFQKQHGYRKALTGVEDLEQLLAECGFEVLSPAKPVGGKSHDTSGRPFLLQARVLVA
ncbi:unnamed protein product [Amoebophrya sp. A120]|nr:unnamed protein product [Amoebophrya sp. A120]|eukprot:GSA120T00024992001.1